VPRVVGARLATARRLIVRARCRVGRVRRVYSRRARGRVLSQRPRAGVTRARGTRVNLVVSRGRRG
jgi:beta-lactam-binding protein with PASTA domain